MSAENLAEAFLDAVDGVEERLRTSHGLIRAGTRMSSAAVATVSFEGRGTVLALGCDRGEIDASLARAGREGQSFQIRLVLALAGVGDWRTRWPRIVGAETADRSVDLLVDDVIDHAGPWLEGDADALDRLEEFRDVDLALKMAQFGPGRRLGAVWSPVKEAWDGQDLPRLRDAVDALPEPRREVEERAREYAERWSGR